MDGVARRARICDFVCSARTPASTTAPVTADDVKFSLQALPGRGVKPLKDRVKGRSRPRIQARVRIVSKEPGRTSWPSTGPPRRARPGGAAEVRGRVGEEGFRGAHRGGALQAGVLQSRHRAGARGLQGSPGASRAAIQAARPRTIYRRDHARARAMKRSEVGSDLSVSGPGGGGAQADARLQGVASAAAVGQPVLARLSRAGRPEVTVARLARVRRLAASLTVDRKAVSEAEWLGFARPSGNIVPRALEFALELPPHPCDRAGRGPPGRSRLSRAISTAATSRSPALQLHGVRPSPPNFLRAAGIRALKNMGARGRSRPRGAKKSPA